MVEDRVLRLSFRAPFDGGVLLAWLAARAVPGVEEVAGEVYRRSLRLAHGPGVAELAVEDGDVRCRLWLEDRRDVTTSREIEPVAFAGTRAHWYLMAWCRLRDGARAFRLDRIRAAVGTGEPAPQRSYADLDVDIPDALVQRVDLAG